LAGTCVWNLNKTTTAYGAKPSGVSVVNCGEEQVVYKSEKAGQWPADGKVNAGTYTDVKATVSCGGVTLESDPCPSLVVEVSENPAVACSANPGGINCNPGDVKLASEGKCADFFLASPDPHSSEWTGPIVYCGGRGPNGVTLSFTIEKDGVNQAVVSGNDYIDQRISSTWNNLKAADVTMTRVCLKTADHLPDGVTCNIGY
jgi:hypothetical protein